MPRYTVDSDDIFDVLKVLCDNFPDDSFGEIKLDSRDGRVSLHIKENDPRTAARKKAACDRRWAQRDKAIAAAKASR